MAYIIGALVGSAVVACILALIYVFGIRPKLTRQVELNKDIE